MPPYTFNPAKASATTEIFPKGDYEFVIGEPKAFIRKAGQGTENEHDSYGVRFPLTIAEGEFKGKKINTFSIYHHSEGAAGPAKQFLMAAFGYPRNRAGEERFNEEQGEKDWSCEYESGAVGDAYRELTGARIIGTLDVQRNKQNGDEQQQFKSWRPIGS